jgi:polyphosphate kinase
MAMAGMGASLERYSQIAAELPPIDGPVDLAVDTGHRTDAPVDLAAGATDRADAPVPDPAPATLPRAAAPRPVTPDHPLDHPHLYFNRELSWLDFNWRVLHQAMDPRTPLLERARYLAITQSNLDEFFAKRVGGLKRQLQAGVTQLSPDGRTPAEQLLLIRSAVLEMQAAMTATWQQVRRELEDRAGVRIMRFAELNAEQQHSLQELFRKSIYPILTPLAVDPGHPFPFISNLSHSLAVVLVNGRTGTGHFARVKVPTRPARWLAAGRDHGFIAMEDVVRAFIGELFPGMQVAGTYLFRVTRNADVKRNEEEASDLVAMIAEELRERRFAPVVRLEVEADTPPAIMDLLRRELEVELDDIYPVYGLQDLTGLAGIANLDMPHHRFEPWEPVVPAVLHHEPGAEPPDIFAALRAGDILVHHPYDSFGATVERFIEAAAADPRVLAIKQTVYRTSEDSAIVRALMRAADRGKQVAVLVELTARFDEERNLNWAQQLEDCGAHVTYGVLGLKTHAKVSLVVREEPDGIRTYCHIGTGNYHAMTARLYTDIGLLTADPTIGRDVVDLFHAITGHATDPVFETLVVAPWGMRARFAELIRREREIQRAGGTGRIIAKMNALDDTDMIQALYSASRDGVSIDLIVRGHTRLRPGLPGISENIRIISIVGRFLEHDRIFWFGNDGRPEVFIGSADWRRRNLDERVEAAVGIADPRLLDRLTGTLQLALADNRLAWELDGDGYYTQRRPPAPEAEIDYHRTLMSAARDRRHAGELR